MPESDLNLQSSVTLQGYLAYLSNERNYSPLTAENYARDIRRLFALAGTTALSELKSHQIRRYIAQLHSSGLGGRSLARVLSAWRGFYAYLMRDHGCQANRQERDHGSATGP